MQSNKKIDPTKPLHILGFAPDVLNVLLELAEDALGFRSFCVLENIPRASDEDYVPMDHYEVSFKNFSNQNYSIDPQEYFAFGVLGRKSKELVYRYFKEKIGMPDDRFLNLIHPTAVISKSAQLRYGIQVGINSSVNTLTEIGFGTNIKNNCYLGHHGKIGKFVTINPGVTVSGMVEIGNNTIIGAGAVIRDHAKIGDNCTIGMGSSVVKDIPNNSIAYGNPCRIHGENE